MLSGFVSAFRTPDLRRKILFTLGIIALYRLGAAIPTPGVNYSGVRQCIDQSESNSVLDLINVFSGGALLQLSIFALGIMPYITASIMVQLLRTLIPRFQTLHQEGPDGQAKLTQYTRYITVGFAVIQSASYITLARNGLLIGPCDQMFPNESWYVFALMILAMTTGTVLIMWLGERITEGGIGNGMSLLIFASIAASFPAAGIQIANAPGQFAWFWVLITALVIIVAIVFVEQSQRRIPVQYAKRMVGRKMLGGSSTYIPIKINMAGIIPVIFASSLMTIPQLVSQFSGDDASGWVLWLQNNFASQSSPYYIGFFTLMIVFFAYFYTAITFNPEEVAENMKKYGGFIPGIRPGKPTAQFLDYVLSRITAAGSLYLAAVALIPTLVFIALNLNQAIPFGGTSLLIVVGVGLDTVKRIQSQLESRHYEGFLK